MVANLDDQAQELTKRLEERSCSDMDRNYNSGSINVAISKY